MNRRHFFKNSSLFAIGSTLSLPVSAVADTLNFKETFKNRKAKNIIFLVSDGMSSGTLNIADVFLNRTTGKSSNWIQLYKDQKVSRALMDTASASSIVTDSAAASSSWGSGFRVNNGSINVGTNGEEYLPIWQKFKKKGKSAGCVTTVPITHATPSGFCVNSKSRNGQSDIAVSYLDINFDVMMGGGLEYFAADKRKDNRDLLAEFEKKGYHIAKDRDGMLQATNGKPILGVFYENGLPYSIDRQNDEALKKTIPTLAEMTQVAIDKMKSNPNGFVLQVEGGKVDWGAHSNDIAALLHEQIAFDEAIKVAMDFAEKDQNTLVIITTDHGNSNPGIIYGKEANSNFDNLQKYKKTNEWLLNQIHPDSSVSKVKELVEFANGTSISDENAKTILGFYTNLTKEQGGLYNYNKLPYEDFATIQKKSNSIGWISMDHSADHVELAMYGPGSELLKPFMINTDLHYLMLKAAEVENKF